jgi:glycosyltransferase involved in cell wall biosynthesis
MRLGVVYIPEQVNAFYRAYLPMVALHERGHQVVEVLQRRGTPLPVAELARCDAVHIHRLLLTEDDDDCVARLRDAGVAVCLDDDDDSEAAPPELEGLVAEGSLERARRDFARLLARAPQADLVTTPSVAIADRFERAGAPQVRVIENHLPGAFNRVRALGHEGLVIGWHAASEHRLDADALGLEAVLGVLLERHRDVHVVTVGLDLRLDHERYRREEFVPIAELTQLLADFDVGIVPLADTPFNRARSNVKARELAAAGVPWLASPVGAYRSLGREQGGMLVEEGDWLASLEALIGARRERAKLAKRARAWAQRETIWTASAQWEQAFHHAIASARRAGAR